MPGPAEDLPISLEELRTAVASRDLPGLVARLVRERSWGALISLFGYAGSPAASTLALPELDAAARAASVALDAVAVPKGTKASVHDELRAVRIAAAEALLSRGGHPPFSEPERRTRRLAAALLSAAGDHGRAARTHEELGDDVGAADAWGAAGDLDQMEAAHAREEARVGARRAATDALRSFDVLLAAGERRHALAVAAALPTGVPEAATARALAERLEARLVRARGVTLRLRGGPAVRLAALPATLGRDPLAEVALRDPGVSRQHAVVRLDEAGLVVEDRGSRGGVRVGGARVDGPFRLHGEGELMLGATTALRFCANTPQRLVLRGVAGLDRELVALVGQDPLDLAEIVPGAEGLALELSGGGARLVRAADVAVRVDGHFVGPGCDLLHGDVVEVPARPALAFEVG
jgi:hypothetical protein